jgi:phosphatidylglycerophosphate synthase
MNVSLWRLPDAPLRTSAVTSTLAGLLALVVLASMARTALPLGDLYPLKASAAFAAVMLVSFGFLRQHHPFERFGAANQITTARVMLVALIAGLIGEPRLPVIAASAAAASLLVTALDGVDGWLARRHRIASDFGARFDMEIDALLILVLAILAWRNEKAGAWVVLSGLLRYAFAAAGARAPWLNAALPPSRRRQTICVIQIVALTLALLPAVLPPLSALLAAVALLTLCYSFLVDILWLSRYAP